jgi:DNA-binding protein HU-beta
LESLSEVRVENRPVFGDEYGECGNAIQLSAYQFLISIGKGECMNKGELIESVAAASDLSRADATKAVDALLGSVTSTLAGGGSVALVGFGTFSVKARAARMGRNPRTGEPIQIKASNVPGFKAGKALKDAVN